MTQDILIIGSGISALRAAIEIAKKKKVTLITKKRIMDANSSWAQGGLAAVLGSDDTTELHIQDTQRAGDGIVSEKAARILAAETPDEVKRLAKWGVPFEKDNNRWVLSREAVHSRARIVHVKDRTGEEVMKVLARKVKEHARITIHEHTFAKDLIIQDGRCVGAIIMDTKRKEISALRAPSVLLATGGAGMLYERTTNPEVATGDGIAMALRAGAILQDMEFMQFHPTMLHRPGPSLLLSETLRGEGGLLKNVRMKTYMHEYHRDGDLAPRDVVARFSVEEMKRTRSQYVLLDITHMRESYIKKRFPTIYKACMDRGIDITQEPIPVSPAAHYLCGGIRTDDRGRTSIEGLFAIGECACTGLHGADRLASNSLTEGIVFGRRCAKAIIDAAKQTPNPPNKSETPKKHGFPSSSDPRITRYRRKVRKIMQSKVGIVRTKKGLQKAIAQLVSIRKRIKKKRALTPKEQEILNMSELGIIMARAAYRRKESRGTHFLKDYPIRMDAIFQKHLVIDRKSL